jgi:LPXTG-motif cell wall-anchored protein
VTPTEPVTVTPVADASTSSGSGGLPFTGADIAELSTVGAGLLLAGGLGVWHGRRRSRSA